MKGCLLGKKALPLGCWNMPRTPGDEHDDMTTIRKSLTVVAETNLIPEESEPRVVVAAQTLDVMPTAKLWRKELSGLKSRSNLRLGNCLAA
jgi:hypothetical protein